MERFDRHPLEPKPQAGKRSSCRFRTKGMASRLPISHEAKRLQRRPHRIGRATHPRELPLTPANGAMIAQAQRKVTRGRALRRTICGISRRRQRGLCSNRLCLSSLGCRLGRSAAHCGDSASRTDRGSPKEVAMPTSTAVPTSEVTSLGAIGSIGGGTPRSEAGAGLCRGRFAFYREGIYVTCITLLVYKFISG
jgi:hypothetical protein